MNNHIYLYRVGATDVQSFDKISELESVNRISYFLLIKTFIRMSPVKLMSQDGFISVKLKQSALFFFHFLLHKLMHSSNILK